MRNRYNSSRITIFKAMKKIILFLACASLAYSCGLIPLPTYTMKRSPLTSFKEKIAFSNARKVPVSENVVTDLTHCTKGAALIFFPDGMFFCYGGYDTQFNHQMRNVYSKQQRDKWGVYRLDGNVIKVELLEIVNFVNCRDMIVYVGVYDEEHGTITFSKPEVDGTDIFLSVDYKKPFVRSPQYDTLNVDPSKAWINEK